MKLRWSGSGSRGFGFVIVPSVVAGNVFEARCCHPCSCRSKLHNECLATFTPPFPAHPLIRSPQWSIKLHSGSGEALQQYRANLTAMAVHLERLAQRGEVYWVLQGQTASLIKQMKRSERQEACEAFLSRSRCRSGQRGGLERQQEDDHQSAAGAVQ